MSRKTKVLLAEDDLQLSFVIKDNLEESGYEVFACPDGETAWDYFQKSDPDICLLDVNMPERDGFSLAKKIRQKSEVVPILFITAKSQTEDKIKGFHSGGDDYLTKPFSIKELLLRMKVFERRNLMLSKENPWEFTLGSLRFIPAELKLTNGQEKTILTQREADLLEFFCLHQNKVIKREEVLTHVWGKSDFFLGRSMDVFITKLRKHLATEKNISLETIHGVGYRFVVG